MSQSIVQSREAFEDIERLLQLHELQLRAETAFQVRQIGLPLEVFPDLGDTEAAMMWAQDVHRLVFIATVLYPSEITLRREYRWAAASHLLRQHGVGFEQQAMLLKAYCNAVRSLLDLPQRIQAALDRLEQNMLRVAAEVFQEEG